MAKLTLNQINAMDSAQLTQRELMVLRLDAVLDDNGEDVAELMGTTRQYIGQVRTKAMRKLKQQGFINEAGESIR